MSLPPTDPHAPARVVDWSVLRHAYGPADDTPGLLDGLRGEDWSEVVSELFGSILHQGSVYPATVAALPFIEDVARDAAAPGRVGALWLLGAYAESIAAGAGRVETYLPEGTDPVAFDAETRAARDASVGTLIVLLDDPDPQVRAEAYGWAVHLTGSPLADTVAEALRGRLALEDEAVVALMEPLLRHGAFDDTDLAVLAARHLDEAVFAAAWSSVASGHPLDGAVDLLVHLWPDHADGYPASPDGTSLEVLSTLAGVRAVSVVEGLQAAGTVILPELADAWFALAKSTRAGAAPALAGLLALVPSATSAGTAARLVDALVQVVAAVPEREREVADVVAHLGELASREKGGAEGDVLAATVAVALFVAQDARWAASAVRGLLAADEPRVATDSAHMPFSRALQGFPARRHPVVWAADDVLRVARGAFGAWPGGAAGWVGLLARLPATQALVHAVLPVAAQAPRQVAELLARTAAAHPGVFMGDLRPQVLDALGASETSDGASAAWQVTARALLTPGDEHLAGAFAQAWELGGGDAGPDADLLAVWASRSAELVHATCSRLLDGAARRSFPGSRARLVAAGVVAGAASVGTAHEALHGAGADVGPSAGSEGSGTEDRGAWPTVRAIVDAAGPPLVEAIEVGNRLVACDPRLRDEWSALLHDIAWSGRTTWSGPDPWSGAVALDALVTAGWTTPEEAVERGLALLLGAAGKADLPRVAPFVAPVLRAGIAARADLGVSVAQVLLPLVESDGRFATDSIVEDERALVALRGVLA